jgi:hypothetical protein
MLFAVGLALVIYVSIPTRYQSTGVMVLTSPAAGGKVTPGGSPENVVQINPLLAFDGSLTTTAQILGQILGDPQTRTQLGAGSGSTSTFTAKNGDQNGPFVFVLTEANSPQTAQALVGKIMERARQELNERQKSLQAPAQTFISAETLVQPTEAEAQIGGKVRYGGAALVLLLLLTTVATFGADSVLMNLKRRREAEDDDLSKTKDKVETQSVSGDLGVGEPPLPTAQPRSQSHQYPPPRSRPQAARRLVQRSAENADQATVIVAVPDLNSGWSDNDNGPAAK